MDVLFLFICPIILLMMLFDENLHEYASIDLFSGISGNFYVSLPLPYPQLFQLIIVIDGLFTLGLYLWLRRLSKNNYYYGFVRGMTFFMAVVLVGLIISYVAQATFMGWF